MSFSLIYVTAFVAFISIIRRAYDDIIDEVVDFAKISSYLDESELKKSLDDLLDKKIFYGKYYINLIIFLFSLLYLAVCSVYLEEWQIYEILPYTAQQEFDIRWIFTGVSFVLSIFQFGSFIFIYFRCSKQKLKVLLRKNIKELVVKSEQKSVKEKVDKMVKDIFKKK